MQWHNTSLKQVTATRIANQLLISTVPTSTLPELGLVWLVTNVAVFLSRPYVVQVPPWAGGGVGDGKTLEGQTGQSSRCTGPPPLGAAWTSIPCTSHWHYRTAGEEEGGTHKNKSSLALPLFVSSDQ